MSTASTIARGQPDDSQGVTRRACEAARVARASKHRPENLDAWQSYEKRLARWHAREKNEKPKPLQPGIQDPPCNEFVPQLMERIGMYSDAAVHFTPEFMVGLSWRNEVGAEIAAALLRPQGSRRVTAHPR
jgi:16S rRNA C967 or C1407 C5-methylase (RsmB/RsmF family)